MRPLHRNELIVIDGIAAGLLGAVYFLVLNRPAWLTALLVLLVAAPVAVRRMWPVPVFALVALTSVVALSAGVLRDPLLAAAFTAYTAAALGRRPHRRGWLTAGVTGAVLLLLSVSTGSAQPWPDRIALLLPGLALVGGVWSSGAAIRERRAYTADRLEHAMAEQRRNGERALAEERLNAERALADERLNAERAVVEERLRVARDVHDIVTHNLGVITVKAAVARHVAAAQPGEAVAALEAIEQVSRAALAEMRQSLRVLRADGRVLGDLRSLVDRAGQDGLDVRCDLTGSGEVPAPVAGSAYRIVQEALTNVTRHAGPTRCRVSIHSGTDELVVEIEDEGGYGLIGMRERVALHGGELDAGHRPSGGYRVRARLPYAAGPSS